MEALECLKTRRSIRKFKQKAIPKEIIEKQVDAVRCAPSSRDCQPWEFIVVKLKRTKEQLAKLKGEDNKNCLLGAHLTEARGSVGERRQFLNAKGGLKLGVLNPCLQHNREAITSAPIVIIICVDRNRSKSRWVEDGALAAENLLLAAHDSGLGAVYITGYSPEDSEMEKMLQKILGLPAAITPFCIIPVGYPNEEPEPKALRSLAELTHHEEW